MRPRRPRLWLATSPTRNCARWRGARPRWKRFVARHQEYTQEERQLSAAVFGSEFARGYSAVVGEELSDKSAKLGRGKP